MLSEEASRSAAVAILKDRGTLETTDEVDEYIDKTAQDLGLYKEWQHGQRLIKESKEVEK